jgi:hypothetical protein
VARDNENNGTWSKIKQHTKRRTGASWQIITKKRERAPPNHVWGCPYMGSIGGSLLLYYDGVADAKKTMSFY